MSTSISRNVPSRKVRDELAEILGTVAYGGERVGVTRHGKLTAVIISAQDLALLEDLEAARDAAEYDRAKGRDDGRRVFLDELRAELA